MRAVRVHEPGGPEVLRVEELPPPTPGPGEALVKIEAVGVNFIDVYQRSGRYRATLPLTIGQEAAGTVTALGPGVKDFRVGDRIAYAGIFGAYAELARVPADRLVPLPAGVTAKQAAAVMLQGMTAHYLSHTTYPLASGDTCLVHAAAGGVGLLLCQMAKRRGARVLGTVSTEQKARLAREAGADDVILYSERDFVAEARRLTRDAGVQVVYDAVGKTTFLKGLDCLAPRGMMVLYGQSSGPVEPLDPQVLNQKGSLFLTRPTLHTYVATRAELLARAGAVLSWVEDGSLTLRMEHEFPLARAADAHRELEARRTTGKILLIP